MQANGNFAHLNKVILTQARLAEANFDVENFMNLVVEQVQELTKATGVVVELIEGDDMVYRAAIGTVKEHVGLHHNMKASISGLCVQSREILQSEDTENDPRVNLQACRLVKARSMVVAPLFHQGETLGVLKILSDKPSGFTESDVQTLQLMAGLIGSALAHQIFHETTQKLLLERTQALKELEIAKEKLNYMAHHDYLTHLPNRSLFIDKLNYATNPTMQEKKQIAILFLDIDHFKTVNDTHGHAFGDTLLQAFALRINQCIRKTDLIARLGGDEFIILLNEISDKNDAITIANKILNHMKNPFKFQDKALNISTSIGISFGIDSNADGAELIRQADEALYAAKKAGRNNFKVF